MLTKTNNSVSNKFKVAMPPKDILVPTTTKILTIPIGMQLLKIAIIIAIPYGANSLFTPKLTKESKKDTIYNRTIRLLKHFFNTSFIFVFLLYSTSS